ncbi:hypothetical protein [Emergencia sp. 1XD21-10]|uniref:hypothetical protein n=1 Tax=Emergencia sp. 1XD21-10 TaxID=2304569 RepID=UPI00137967EF|nr:hypothetical protein [Emergencia sp. 1XD21-10]NCE98395.1 hypothetical protein [Emergencia sp. 1XD21-10]
MIRGITFSEQTFYSSDFAHFQNVFLNKQNGVTKGCSVSHDDTQVTISPGYFFIQGRLLNVEENEAIASDRGFAEGFNRIVYEIDLSKENTIEEFRQGYIKVLNTEDLVQEDLDGGGNVYQFPFCRFQWSGTTITSLIAEAPQLDLDNIFAQIAANYSEFEKEFEQWFTGQNNNLTEWFTQEIENTAGYIDQKKDIIEGMIADLQGQGFENAAQYEEGALLAANWNQTEKNYNFETEYPAVMYDLEIWLNSSATDEQADAFCDARIESVYGRNVAKARGDVPTVDIPVIMKVVRK